MDEYISKDEFMQYLEPLTNTPAIVIKRYVEDMPTADVQPVVHCKDCKHRKERHYEESDEKPYIKYECKFTKYSMSDDGFCSFGAKMLEKPNLQLLKKAVDLIQKAKEI